MKSNDFKEDLKWSESKHSSDWWEPYYRKAFPKMTSVQLVGGPSSAQRAGIDKFIILSGGKKIAVDEKIRRDRPPTDIALEFLHVPTVGDPWPGWVEKETQFTDYLAYGFEKFRVAFFFPFLNLQSAWTTNKEQWLKQYGRIRAFNGNATPPYHTHSCCIPTEVLMGHILCSMRVQL